MKIRVTGVIKYAGDWRRAGDILDEVPEHVGRKMVAQGVGTELESDPAGAPLPAAGEVEELRQELARLQEFERQQLAKEEAEQAAKKLKALRKKATELGIEGAADKDADTLTAEIAAAEKK